MEPTRSSGSPAVDDGDGRVGRDREGGCVYCAAGRRRRIQPLTRGRSASFWRAKRTERDDTSPSSSSSSSSSSSFRQLPQQRGVRLRKRNRGLWVSPGGRGGNECVQDLALPLGMSFAAVVAQVQFLGFSQSILSTAEKSVIEQTRSNDLKAIEIGLVMKKLQLKQAQLALSSDANFLEKFKISMGMSKASFREAKLRDQMQETRNAQLLKRCMDLLITGLILMCSLLVYGASIYSYQRITEVTSACTSVAKVYLSSFDVLDLCAGVFWIRNLIIALLVFRRSVMSATTMPVTFIVLLLGALCGFSGKQCVDTLGGNGYYWLIYWEALCMLHFVVNVFPSASYHVLYGPVAVLEGANSIKLPYWIRRFTFYALLLLVLPTSGEPALVPQWYKLATGSTSNNSLRSSSSRHSGSSGKSQAYSSFRRSRDRNQERDFDSCDRKNRSVLVDNGLDHLDSFLGVRSDKDALRRSQSMIAGRPVDSWPKRLGSSANNSGPSGESAVGSISKTFFERDFPSLRAEGRQGLSDVVGVSPLGLRTAVQSLPTGSPIIIGTSALAEVPVKVETSAAVLSPILQAASISQASAAGSTMTGLNMAEALAQPASQVVKTPQVIYRMR
ncbi:hypothetical protein BHM03_00037597 [Ensete ventricosum]|nr:hypothetical protein BHM03_00037597 [Ensete ventricosum]